jgi:hypothetical protein
MEIPKGEANLKASHEEMGLNVHSKPALDITPGLQTLDAGLPVDQVTTEMDKIHERNVIRKLDYRLIPLLSMLYL